MNKNQRKTLWNAAHLYGLIGAFEKAAAIVDGWFLPTSILFPLIPQQKTPKGQPAYAACYWAKVISKGSQKWKFQVHIYTQIITWMRWSTVAEHNKPKKCKVQQGQALSVVSDSSGSRWLLSASSRSIRASTWPHTEHSEILPPFFVFLFTSYADDLTEGSQTSEQRPKQRECSIASSCEGEESNFSESSSEGNPVPA